MSAPLNTRPAPIREAFRSVGSTIALLGSVVTALVGWGVLTAAQGDATTGLLGLIPGVVTAATQVVTAFKVARVAEAGVTPNADPAVEVVLPGGDTALVGLVPDREQLRELGISPV